MGNGEWGAPKRTIGGGLIAISGELSLERGRQMVREHWSDVCRFGKAIFS